MPLPLEKLRVYPNPWCFWTLKDGPQGFLAHGGTRGVGPLRYIGAAKPLVREARPAGDPRGNDAKYEASSWPGLNPDLVSGTPLEFPANDPFVRDRLVDGSLVAADASTAKGTGALFDSLEKARAACIRDFEAHYGPGSFAEKFAGKPFVPGAKAKEKTDEGAVPVESTGKGGKG